MKKIALAIDGNKISAHFGRCPNYLFVEIDGKKIIKQTKLANPGHERGLIPKFIHEQGADTIICGGMGFRAQQFFQQYGVTPILGIKGPIDTVLSQLVDGTLEGGKSTCSPGGGKDYGISRTDLDPEHEHNHHHH